MVYLCCYTKRNLEKKGRLMAKSVFSCKFKFIHIQHNLKDKISILLNFLSYYYWTKTNIYENNDRRFKKKIKFYI